MPTVVVFDCESDSRPVRVGRDVNFQHVQCTVACALVIDTKHVMLPESAGLAVATAKEITCWRDVVPSKGASPFKELFDAFDAADVIVGYNSLDFDMPLLKKHYGSKEARRYIDHRIKSLDVFSRVRSTTGVWPKLDDLLCANQLGAKCGDGAQAIQLWQDGRRDELKAYCMTDVRRTAELALLTKMCVNGTWLPSHVYGIGPTVHSVRVSEAATCCRLSVTPSPTPIEQPESETASGDEVFIVVPPPGGVL